MEEPIAIQPQDAVIVDFVGRYCPTKEDANRINDNDSDIDEQFPIFHVAKDWLLIVTEKEVVPALEMGIRFANLHETIQIWSHAKFAYGPNVQRTSNGPNSSYKLPANANVCYTVTIKGIVPEAERHDAAFQIRASRAKKNIGNDVYQNEWYAPEKEQSAQTNNDNSIHFNNHNTSIKAIQLYKRAASNLEFLVVEQPDNKNNNDDSKKELRAEALSILLDCLNNIVAVHMRAKRYHQAKEAAVQVLQFDGTNTKALLRAAKASLLDPASSYEEVQAAIDAAQEHASDESTMAEVRKLKADLKRRKQEYKRKSKEMFAKMVHPTVNDDTTAKDGNGGDDTKRRSKTSKETSKDDSVLDSGKDSVKEEEPPAGVWEKALMSLLTQLVMVGIIYLFVIWMKRSNVNLVEIFGLSNHNDAATSTSDATTASGMDASEF